MTFSFCEILQLSSGKLIFAGASENFWRYTAVSAAHDRVSGSFQSIKHRRKVNFLNEDIVSIVG